MPRSEATSDSGRRRPSIVGEERTGRPRICAGVGTGQSRVSAGADGEGVEHVKEEVHVVLGERALSLRGAGGRRPGSCYDGRGREEQP
jgi:hypothetical protein